MAKTKTGWSPLAIGITAVVVGAGGYLAYDYFTSTPTTPTPDPTPPNTNGGGNTTPPPKTGGDLPDFSKWDIAWPLEPPIDSAVIAKLPNGAKVAFVIRLVQQRLIDLGDLKISATTGQFLDQTKQALIDYKVRTLNIPASTANIEKIGIPTMQKLFNDSYAVYDSVYSKLATFYTGKGETIPAGFKGFGAPSGQSGQIVTTIKATDVYVKTNEGGAVAFDKVPANADLGTVTVESNGWVGFTPFNTNAVLWVPKWAIRYN